MDQASSTSQTAGAAQAGGSFSVIDAITTTHLVLIAVLAVLVVIAMLYGVRLKNRRTAAQAEEQQRLDAYDDEHPGGAPTGSAETPIPDAPATTAGQQEQRAVAPPSPPSSPAGVTDTVPPPAPAAEHRATQPPAPTPALSVAVPPAPSPAMPPMPPASDRPTDAPVTQLKGLGPKVAARLAELGITGVGQIAALDEDAADALDTKLGAFQGRIARDRWVEQARFLAAGDRAGFEAVFGKL